MTGNCVVIGLCVGCNARAVLVDGACSECLKSPSRGPKWVELARRVRTDPKFAASCYARLRTDEERQQFIQKYGPPLNADKVVIIMVKTSKKPKTR